MKYAVARLLAILMCLLLLCSPVAVASDASGGIPQGVAASASSMGMLCVYSDNRLVPLNVVMPIGGIRGKGSVFVLPVSVINGLGENQNIAISDFRILYANEKGEFLQYGLDDKGILVAENQLFAVLITKSPVENLNVPSLESIDKLKNGQTVYLLDMKPNDADAQTYSNICYLSAFNLDSLGEVTGVEGTAFALYNDKDLQIDSLCPAVNENGGLLGIAFTYQQEQKSWILLDAASIVKGAKATLEASGSAGIGGSQPDIQKYLPWIIAAVAVIAIAFAAVSYNKKRAKNKDEANESQIIIGSTTPEDQWEPTHVTSKVSFIAQCLSGALAGERIKVDRKLVIGRDPLYAEILYPSETPGVSSVHCSLDIVNGQLTITDLGSTYGTYVGSEKLVPNAPRSLYIGDVFYLGDKNNRFEVKEG